MRRNQLTKEEKRIRNCEFSRNYRADKKKLFEELEETVAQLMTENLGLKAENLELKTENLGLKDENLELRRIVEDLSHERFIIPLYNPSPMFLEF